MSYLLIHTVREGYNIDQVNRTVTVGELIELLEECDEDMPVFLGFDSCYTYGGITENNFEIRYQEDADFEEE